MSRIEFEMLLLLGMLGCGAVAGWLLPRWGTPSGWAALVFPVVLPLVGIGLMFSFC